MNRLSLRNNRLKFKTAGKTIDHLREMYRIYPNLIKEKRRMSTCNRLDSQTLGSQPVICMITGLGAAARSPRNMASLLSIVGEEHETKF